MPRAAPSTSRSRGSIPQGNLKLLLTEAERHVSVAIIDADGHVLEDPSVWTYFKNSDAAYVANTSLVWPPIDHFHSGVYVPTTDVAGGKRGVGPAEWGAFIEAARLRYSVLYPSSGLALCNTPNAFYASSLARAYNDWLHDRYLRSNPRLKGVALLALQDVQGAVAELRRAVVELGMVAGVLPANGLPNHLGHERYWPVYEEAQQLGCPLAVHGGNHAGLGFDDFSAYTPVNGLGHPFGQMIALSSFVFHGVLDEFSNLRVAFLEAGSAWLSLWADRMDRSYRFHVDLDSFGKRRRLREKQPSDYLRGGRVFVGCEGGEPSLAAQISRFGNGICMFTSDFPHEVSAAECLHEVDEILEAADLSDDDKEALLSKNAARFYAYAGVDVALAYK
jgi:predicted TIM-barrel fold metal-dependent hydrolase